MNRKVCSAGASASFQVQQLLYSLVAPDQAHQVLGRSWVERQDRSECTSACSRTASNHPAAGVALVDTRTVAGIVRSSEAGVLDFAASGVRVAVVVQGAAAVEGVVVVAGVVGVVVAAVGIVEVVAVAVAWTSQRVSRALAGDSRSPEGQASTWNLSLRSP